MNFKTWTIKKKLWMLASLMSINLLLLGLFEFKLSFDISKNLDKVEHVHMPAVRSMTLVDMMHDGIRAVVFRSFVEGNDPEMAEEIKNEYKEFSENITKNLADIDLLDIAEDTRKSIEESKSKIDTYVKAGQSVLALTLNGNFNQAVKALPDFQKQFKDLESSLEVLGEKIEKDSNDFVIDSDKSLKTGKILGVVMIFAFLAIGLLFSYWIISNLLKDMTDIIGHLNNESNTLDSAATQINSASSQLSETTTQQAAAIEETVSSMEEMTAMLAQTTQQSAQSLTVSEKGQSEAENAKVVIERLSKAMDEIQGSNAKLEGIVKLIEEIKNKTKVINDIVFETRLLSFNASIEAARAGAHGKGFAVVAEEVGKLASMSGKAADEIRNLLDSSTLEVTQVVKGTQDRVNQGKAVSQDAAQVFEVMGESLHQIAESVKMISSASREQEIGVKQTNQAMSEMDQITQRNTRGADALSSEASKLSVGSKALQSTVQKMRVMFFGNVEFSSEAPLDISEPAHQVSNKVDLKVASLVKKTASRKDGRWGKAA